MTNITDLPVETVEAIIDVIVSESPTFKDDLANLRVTCEYLDEILAPRVLSTIILNLRDWRHVEYLTQMGTRPNRAHACAKSLKIKCLAPTNNTNRRTPYIVQKNRSERNPGQSETGDVVQTIPIVSLYLSKALCHFRNLEFVEWLTHAFDIRGTNQLVMDMLCSQKNLKSICIDMSRDLTFPHPQFGQLFNLSELSMTFPQNHMGANSLFSGLTQALRNSLDLAKLQVKFQPEHQHQYTEDYNGMYKQIASLKNVRKLSLRGATLRCLGNFCTFCDMAHLTSLEVRPECAPEGLGDVWKVLKERRIHLKNICFNVLFLGPAFVQYLSSYFGVEELWLSNEEEYRVNPSPNHADLARGFLDAIVTNHADTLRVLEFDYYPVSAMWGDGHERVYKLAQLRFLSRLRIELREDEMEVIRVSYEYRRLCNLLEAPLSHEDWWD